MTTKNKLAEKLIEKLNYLSKDDALTIVNEVAEFMKIQLCVGNRIEIRGLGTWSIREKKYANQNKKYKTIYYRMSKNVQKKLI